MSEISTLVQEITEQASADVEERERREVRLLVEDAYPEFEGNRETFVNRVAVAIDIELGSIQDEYEEHVLDEGGFIVEENGVSYGFDADGEQI